MAKRSEPIRLAIAGLGRAGWGMHTKELKGRDAKFRIVAGCDVMPERTAELGAACDARQYTDLADLLKDDEVELVSIATRSADHVAHAIAALKAGKHVFLEKPIGMSYAEAKKLVPAAKRAKGQLLIRHNRRFEPGFVKIREIIRKKLLGEVYDIKLCRHNYQLRSDWQTIIEHGGGQLLNWGPHIVDHAVQLLESPIADMWSDLKLVAAKGDAEDHLKIILKGENGRVVDLEISGGAALREDEYIIFGTHGALRSSGKTIHLRYMNKKTSPRPRQGRADPGTPDRGASFGGNAEIDWVEETIEVVAKQTGNTASIWDHVHASIRGRKPFPITLDEALMNMKVISDVKKGTPFDLPRSPTRGRGAKKKK